MIDAAVEAFSAPFTTSIGWQAFFMGLLGLKTLRKTKDFITEYADRKRRVDVAESESE